MKTKIAPSSRLRQQKQQWTWAPHGQKQEEKDSQPVRHSGKSKSKQANSSKQTKMTNSWKTAINLCNAAENIRSQNSTKQQAAVTETTIHLCGMLEKSSKQQTKKNINKTYLLEKKRQQSTCAMLPEENKKAKTIPSNWPMQQKHQSTCAVCWQSKKKKIAILWDFSSKSKQAAEKQEKQKTAKERKAKTRINLCNPASRKQKWVNCYKTAHCSAKNSNPPVQHADKSKKGRQSTCMSKKIKTVNLCNLPPLKVRKQQRGNINKQLAINIKKCLLPSYSGIGVI